MCSGHIYHNLSCFDDLSKFGKEYLNSVKCEFCTFFSRKNSENFDLLHAFLGLTVTKVSSLKTVRFFGPPCIYLAELAGQRAPHLRAANIANESVPIQLAQCPFPRLAFPMLKYKYILQIKYTAAISTNSTRKLLWFEFATMLISV